MTEDRDDLNFLGALGLLAVGALIGAAAALLLAPRRARERASAPGEGKAGPVRPGSAGRSWPSGPGDGRATRRSGPRSTSGAAARSSRTPPAQLKAAFEAGRGAMREEIARLRGRDEPREGSKASRPPASTVRGPRVSCRAADPFDTFGA